MKKYCLFLTLLFTSLIGFANPPPANAVFQLTAQASDPNSLLLKWSIQDGFFLYQKAFKVTSLSTQELTVGTLVFPKALQKTDTKRHLYSVYRNPFALPVPVLGKRPGEYFIKVNFQGCSDDGFCYPPQEKTIKLVIDNTLALNQAIVESPTVPTDASVKTTRVEQLFANNNWVIIILSFFGFGLLLSFTPCVLPMIPVLSGIIVGHGHDLSTRKAFFLSLSYVLSMSLTYSLIGAVIALMGSNLQVAMQSPWAIGIFSLMFVLLALSMFNVYELRLPLALQSKMANITRSQHGGHYLSAALMGCLSILILSPCVTAPLIGVLGYIAHEGNVGLGILSLFFLGLGMGAPLLLIGTSAGKFLPRAGQWMNEVKSFFGVMLLAVAIYLSARLLPTIVTMGLWACLLIFSGLYLGALSRAQSRLETFNQGTGLILLCYGFLILIGASQGHNNPLLPLKQVHHNVQSLDKTTVNTLADAQAALIQAQKAGKPVLIDFYADWCASCKIISATTMRDSQVKTALEEYTTVIVDLSKNNVDSQQLLSYFHVIAPPTFLFFDAEGRELDTLRLTGEISASALLEQLKFAQKISL